MAKTTAVNWLSTCSTWAASKACRGWYTLQLQHHSSNGALDASCINKPKGKFQNLKGMSCVWPNYATTSTTIFCQIMPWCLSAANHGMADGSESTASWSAGSAGALGGWWWLHISWFRPRETWPIWLKGVLIEWVLNMFIPWSSYIFKVVVGPWPIKPSWCAAAASVGSHHHHEGVLPKGSLNSHSAMPRLWHKQAAGVTMQVHLHWCTYWCKC